MHFNYNVKQTSNRAHAQVPVFEDQQDYALGTDKSFEGIALLSNGSNRESQHMCRGMMRAVTQEGK